MFPTKFEQCFSLEQHLKGGLELVMLDHSQDISGRAEQQFSYAKLLLSPSIIGGAITRPLFVIGSSIAVSDFRHP